MFLCILRNPACAKLEKFTYLHLSGFEREAAEPKQNTVLMSDEPFPIPPTSLSADGVDPDLAKRRMSMHVRPKLEQRQLLAAFWHPSGVRGIVHAILFHAIGVK